MNSRDPESWMWAQALEFLERADRLHRQFFQLGHGDSRQPVWEPPVDMFETEAEVFVLAALPGVPADHIDILIDGGVLMLHGERPGTQYERGAILHRLEIPYGRLERRIALPPGRYELGRRELVDGCLVLSLKKVV